MTYTHLNTKELVMIESYHHLNMHISIIAERLNRFRQPTYNIIKHLKSGHTALGVHKLHREIRNAAAAEKWSYSRKIRSYSRRNGTSLDNSHENT